MTIHTKQYKFVCPHNSDVQITGKCPISECPYHMERVKDFFTLEVDKEKSTDCVYHDSDLMTNITASRAQISALSRDTRRVLNPRVMKYVYDSFLSKIKVLYVITHELPTYKTCCKNCGYPESNPRCVSSTICSSRNNWVESVLSVFHTTPTLMKKQIVWEILLKSELQGLEDVVISNGLYLCSKNHIDKFQIKMP